MGGLLCFRQKTPWGVWGDGIVLRCFSYKLFYQKFYCSFQLRKNFEHLRKVPAMISPSIFTLPPASSCWHAFCRCRTRCSPRHILRYRPFIFMIFSWKRRIRTGVAFIQNFYSLRVLLATFSWVCLRNVAPLSRAITPKPETSCYEIGRIVLIMLLVMNTGPLCYCVAAHFSIAGRWCV